jgi:hypothetical protein
LFFFVFNLTHILLSKNEIVNKNNRTKNVKKYRIGRSFEKAKADIFGGSITLLINHYKYKKKLPPRMRNVSWLSFYFARMSIVKPEIKIPQLKEITKMFTKGIKYTKKYNSQGPIAEVKKVAEANANIFLLNKDYENSIKYYEKSNIWRKEFLYKYAIIKYGKSSINDYEARWTQIATRIEIIKAIIAKKKGEEYKTDPKNFTIWKKNKFYDEPQPLQDYLSFLIAFKRLKEFRELILFDLNRGASYSTLFYCKEISEIYFDWFDMHEYWLTPEFKELLKELRKEVLSKTPSCYGKSG